MNRMIKTIALFAMLAPAAASAATLTESEVHAVAAVMFEAYQSGGAPAMLAEENACWGNMDDTPDEEQAKKASAVCVTAAITGAMIERAYAMKQIRGEAGAYRADAIGARMGERMSRRFDEAQLADIETRSVGDEWFPSIITGLMAAGMP